jgi:hypothetical protein
MVKLDGVDFVILSQLPKGGFCFMFGGEYFLCDKCA